MATTILGKYIGFNDTGTGTSDVWSASKIISYVGSYNPFDQSLNTTDDVEFNDLEVTGNIEMPTTTSTTGQIKQNGNTIFHTYGTNNLFLGKDVGNYSTTGYSNTAVGRFSQRYITTGFNNVSVGDMALGSINVGRSNTAVGTFSGRELIAGYNNTFVGYETAGSNVDGIGNIFLGYQAGYNETGNNKLYIANSDTANPLIYGDFSTNALKINGTFNVTGATDLDSSLNVDGALTVGGAVDLNSTLNVDGDTTVQKLTVTGYLTPISRVMGKLSTIGNSSSPTLGSGNYFVHTYTSLIRINASGWTAGSVIVLGFSGNCNVYSSYSASGTNQGIRLQGTVTFTAKAGDTLTLINDGTYWRETSRMVS